MCIFVPDFIKKSIMAARKDLAPLGMTCNSSTGKHEDDFTPQKLGLENKYANIYLPSKLESTCILPGLMQSVQASSHRGAHYSAVNETSR